MTPNERGQLLRERFKARKPSNSVQQRPKKPSAAKWWKTYGTAKIGRGTVALGDLKQEHWRKKWISEPDKVPDTGALPLRRKTAVSPLTVISQKMKERVVWRKI